MTVSKWCAGIVSILGVILYICSAIFSTDFYKLIINGLTVLDGLEWSGMALLLILCAVFMLEDHLDKSMNRNHIRNSMFPGY